MTRFLYKYPGGGYYYVICDVCGRKIRAKDAVLITDKYNYLHNMLVCKDDADKTNPADQIRAVRERQIDNPKLIRPESSDTFVFASEADEIETLDPSDPTGRTASAPKHLTILGASTTEVELVWFGPDDSGSSPATGYQIERESPIGGGFSVIATTTTPAQYYKDTTVSTDNQYNYRVSVVNTAGIGAASNEADITIGTATVTTNYILLENGTDSILLENGSFLLQE